MAHRHRLSASIFVCTWVIAGCGGGSSATSPTASTPTPPAPVANATPTVTSITPSSAIAGNGNLSITIAGTGFVSASSVQFNGTAVSTAFTAATALTATLPAADLANGAKATITVSNPAPGGGVSGDLPFTIENPLPVVKSVNPATVMAGSEALTLDVTGSGFVPSSVVNFNGAAPATTLVSATELKTELPAVNITGSSADLVTVSKFHFDCRAAICCSLRSCA